MKLEPMKSLEFAAVEVPGLIPVPPFADGSLLYNRIFGDFCRRNPELPCFQDENWIKHVFECIEAAGGPDWLTKSRHLNLPAFVNEDPEIKKWRVWYAEVKAAKDADKEGKEKTKEANKLRKEKYGFAIVDGKKEPLQSWVLEPEGIYAGRPGCPYAGYWKMAVTADDVVLNTNSEKHPVLISGDEVINYVDPKTKKSKWHNEWRPESHHCADYPSIVGVPNAQGGMIKVYSSTRKKIMFSAKSSVKTEGQMKKYDAGAELGESYGKILENVKNDFNSKKAKDLGTVIAVFLLFEKGIRIGEKKATTNGTKGLLSLVWGKDVKRSGNKIKFDFLGKDSVHDVSEIETEFAAKIEEHWKEFGQLKTDKNDIKAYIGAIVPELDGIFSPKLARTAVAAYTMTNALEEAVKKFHVTKDSPIALKKLAFEEANMEVAKRLNHQRGVNKVAEEKRKAKFAEKEENLKEREAKVEETIAKREAKIKALKAAKKEGWKDKVKKLQEQNENTKQKYDIAKMNLSQKEKTQNFTASTSKGAYIDPAIVSKWCRKIDMPLERIYSKTQIEQFEKLFK